MTQIMSIDKYIDKCVHTQIVYMITGILPNGNKSAPKFWLVFSRNFSQYTPRRPQNHFSEPIMNDCMLWWAGCRIHSNHISPIHAFGKALRTLLIALIYFDATWNSIALPSRYSARHNWQLGLIVFFYRIAWILRLRIYIYVFFFQFLALTHWGLVTYVATEIWVNIGSGNALLPDGTKPGCHLHQSWLIISHVLWHSPQGNFVRDAQNIDPWHAFY